MKIFTTLLTILLVLLGTAAAVQAEPLISPAWLAKNKHRPETVIIDLRNKIDGGSYETYLQGHIPGAIHSDYLQDGWRVTRDGIVGLLPEAEAFEALARRLGVSADSHVVLVPAGVSATDFGTAARAYWSFKIFGHDRVSILDGGQAAWQQQYPDQLATGAEIAPQRGDFTARFRPQGHISGAAVAKLLAEDGKAVLKDGRTEAQFAGEEKHPKSAAAGRIPGAMLLSQAEAYDGGANRLKPAGELAKIYSAAAAGDAAAEIISYCNTGHWAATNWFVLSEVLGYDNVRLYDGSMVEWTANADNPLATGHSNLDRIKRFLRGIGLL